MRLPLSSCSLAGPLRADAGEPEKLYRIGILEKGRAQVLEGLAAGDEVRLK